MTLFLLSSLALVVFGFISILGANPSTKNALLNENNLFVIQTPEMDDLSPETASDRRNSDGSEVLKPIKKHRSLSSNPAY